MGTEALIASAAIGVVGGAITGSAQSRMARDQFNQAQADRRAAQAAAEPSPEELANLRRMTEQTDKEITRVDKLLASADPAIIEAGKQALLLLEGQDAKTLDPLRRQRGKDRELLEDKLRDQMGPGFESSTAGAQILAEFDAETSSVLAEEQDRSLGRLLGVAEGVSARGRADVLNAGATMATALGNIQGRRVNAISGNPLAQYAGYGNLAQAQFGNVLGGIGRTALMADVFSEGGVSKSIRGLFSGGGSSKTITSGNYTKKPMDLL